MNDIYDPIPAIQERILDNYKEFRHLSLEASGAEGVEGAEYLLRLARHFQSMLNFSLVTDSCKQALVRKFVQRYNLEYMSGTDAPSFTARELDAFFGFGKSISWSLFNRRKAREFEINYFRECLERRDVFEEEFMEKWERELTR